MAVDRPDRDALADAGDRCHVGIDGPRVVLEDTGSGRFSLGLTPQEALRLGHALVQAARKLGAR